MYDRIEEVEWFGAKILKQKCPKKSLHREEYKNTDPAINSMVKEQKEENIRCTINRKN
jgi:hypothetical protein